jgi:hypothetical protein
MQRCRLTLIALMPGHILNRARDTRLQLGCGGTLLAERTHDRESKKLSQPSQPFVLEFLF